MPVRLPHARSRLPLVVLAAGIASAAGRIPPEPASAFVPPAQAARASTRAALVPGGAFDLPAPTPSAHASSIAVRPNGSVLVAWFAGTREGARDVHIHMAELRGGAVVADWPALDRTRLEALTHRVVRKLGNPVVWSAPDGQLHLFVVSVGIGGWSGSAVTHLRSADGGQTWGDARRLVLSPFLNLGTLVRAQPVAMADGSIGLPAYHEFIHKHGLWVQLSPDGRVLRTSAMRGGPRSLQPSVAPLDGTRAVAMLRRGSEGRGGRPDTPAVPTVLRTITDDGGARWIAPRATEVPNPDSGVALLGLPDGSLLMACNPLARGRHVLALLRSTDDGATWTQESVVEDGPPDAECSYPCLALAPDGSVLLSYTFRRERIRVRTFRLGERAP
jgi:predicted neuraminidase